MAIKNEWSKRRVLPYSSKELMTPSRVREAERPLRKIQRLLLTN